MTLEEKIGQLNQYSSSFDLTGPAPTAGAHLREFEAIRDGKVGAMLNVTGAAATRAAQKLAVEHSRLHIPLLFGLDVIHGYRTVFPIPLAEAASWDLAAIGTSSRVSAVEAAASGINWVFAPMVDIVRDARWGRVMESSGEDTYLGARIAATRVHGLQGNDLGAADTVAACAKHFAAYGYVEGGREYNTADLSEHALRNVVLPPFHAAVDAGVATFMNAFTEIGGIPATANRHLQREILKGEWGFTGFVVSDWGSIGELVDHGIARDQAHAAQLALTAGNDMDMMSNAYLSQLAGLVTEGSLSETLIDDAVRRVLRVKFALGLFDDPYRRCDPDRERKELFSLEHRAAARDVARKSIVLLKNENEALPLSKAIHTLAVIGPLAADQDSPLGNWRAMALDKSAVSLLEGLKAAVSPQTIVRYAQGVSLAIGPRKPTLPLIIEQNDRTGMAAAVQAARAADAVVLVVGEDAYQSGEARSQAALGLAGLQEEMLRAICAVNDHVVVVLMNGRPLVMESWYEKVQAIVEAWHLGSEAGHAIADVLFGDYNPSGKLPISFPRSVGQVPLYYSHKSTGRPVPRDGNVFWSHYSDTSNTPRFPFGFGLSYTTFTYSELSLNRSDISAGDSVAVKVTVTNTGNRSGREVVQLYVRDVVGSVTRPVKELKGFQLVELQPGAKQEVQFVLAATDLAFYTAQRRWEAEPGEFRVYVGGNSVDVKEASFMLR